MEKLTIDGLFSIATNYQRVTIDKSDISHLVGEMRHQVTFPQCQTKYTCYHMHLVCSLRDLSKCRF